MDKEYVVEVTYIRPLYFDPNYVTPSNVVVKDTDKTVVDAILQPQRRGSEVIPVTWKYQQLMNYGLWVTGLIRVVKPITAVLRISVRMFWGDDVTFRTCSHFYSWRVT